MRSGTWSIVAIAVLGLVLAVALGIFADRIARGTVALPSTNLASTTTPLAPEQAVTRQASAPRKAPKRRATTTGTTTAAAARTTTTEAGDDHGGRRSGRGSGSSGSGSGSSGSGKSDDHPHAEDD
jgi:uncharacterized membrane protein YgcG